MPSPGHSAANAPRRLFFTFATNVRIVLTTDANGETSVRTSDGRSIDVDSGLLDPSPLVGCEFARDGKSVALASEEFVGIFDAKDSSLAIQDWFPMHDSAHLRFSLDGRYLTGVIPSVSGDERSGFFVYDRRQHFMRTRFGTGACDLTANNQIIVRDLDDAWYRINLSGEWLSVDPRERWGLGPTILC